MRSKCVGETAEMQAAIRLQIYNSQPLLHPSLSSLSLSIYICLLPLCVCVCWQLSFLPRLSQVQTNRVEFRVPAFAEYSLGCAVTRSDLHSPSHPWYLLPSFC